MSMMDGQNAYKNLTLALYVLYALAILSGGCWRLSHLSSII